MSKLLKRFICFTAGILFFAGCEKETVIKIPESIVGTTWEALKGDGITHLSLAFESDKCTLTTTASSAEDEVRTFTYRYSRPELVMTEISNPQEVLTGKIISDGKSYLSMSLNNADNSFTLYLWLVK